MMESSCRDALSARDSEKLGDKEIGILQYGSRNLDMVYPETLCRKFVDIYEGVKSLSEDNYSKEDDLISLEKDNTSSLAMFHIKFGRKADSEAIASVFSSSSSCSMPKRSKSSNQNTQSQTRRCQVEGCNIDLVTAKDYHRRHKICETHSKSPKVIVAGLERRFCQQCSRFHSLSEFDDMKRSCRRRLSEHNARRRRPLGLSSSFPDGRLQNFLWNKTPASASNVAWESLCSVRMGQAGTSLTSLLAHTDRKQHNLHQRHLKTGLEAKDTYAASSFLEESSVFPRALSLLSISCGFSTGDESCPLDQIMQGHISTARPVMQLESQNWPITSKEIVASTSSMHTVNFHSPEDSTKFQDFLPFNTSYEPNSNFDHSS